jgi:hypothetical protein
LRKDEKYFCLQILNDFSTQAVERQLPIDIVEFIKAWITVQIKF